MCIQSTILYQSQSSDPYGATQDLTKLIKYITNAKPLKTVKTRQLNKRNGSTLRILILLQSLKLSIFYAFWHLTNTEEEK
jgi:hypothetical protein